MKKFFNICRMPQGKLKSYVATELESTHKEIVVDDGYVFAQGDFPVLLVAHMDTVHKKLPKFIKNNNGVLSSPNGIGGDDRCGIYMILDIVKQINCSVLFTEDEEIGGIGAGKFARSELAKSLKGKFNYAIEFDRKGNKDAVFYECDNPDFEKFITKEFFKTDFGSYSDIVDVAPVLGCAAVNLSCGYHKAHTKEEYVVWKEMKTSIEQAVRILERTTEKDKFEFIEADYGYGYYSGYYGGYGGYAWGNEDDYIVEYHDKNWNYNAEFVSAVSEIEAVGYFLMDNPELTYNHIIDVYLDDAYITKGKWD